MLGTLLSLFPIQLRYFAFSFISSWLPVFEVDWLREDEMHGE
jgi:hypothetical protein